MMLYPASDASANPQQQPLPIKRRRGRPPKGLNAENSPSELSNGIFTTSPLALNSAAALRVGSPETTSPLMRVSPDKRKRCSIEKVVQTGPKGKRSKSLFVEYTPTKPSPLSSKKEGLFISMLPPSSKTHQKLSEVTGRKSKQQRSKLPAVDSSPNLLNTTLSTPNPNRYQIDDGLLLSSPLANLQQPSSFAKQHTNSSNTMFGQGSTPLTPASQFTSMIHSSPIYQNYYNENLTPSVGKKQFNFDSTFSSLKFDEEEFALLVSNQNQRSNSLTIIDTIGKNISTNTNPDHVKFSSPFQQLVSSPGRREDYIRRSFSTNSIPMSSFANRTNIKPMIHKKKSFKMSLKIGSDGKASISREEQIDEMDETLVLHQPCIKATPRQTIRPSLMTLSSSPDMLNKVNTINNLKSIILNDGDDDSEEEDDEEDDTIINKGESDARSALMKAFKKMV